MRIVTLLEDNVSDCCEGHAARLLTARHGLSLYIESNGLIILFDTGPDGSIIDNSEKLSVDLTEIDFAVVSHGHYDHGGGISAFCGVNTTAPIYLHSKAYQDSHFSQHPEGEMRSADFVVKQNCFDRVVPIDKLSAERCEGVCTLDLSGQVTLITGFPKDGYIPAGNKNLYSQQAGGKIKKDDFTHEIAMLIKENGKNILFTGCSHSGVGNMMKRAGEVAGGESIDYVIGGFHLIDTERNKSNDLQELQILADELAAYPNTQFYTGHCTGTEPLQFLQQKLGKNRIHEIKTGDQFSISDAGGNL
ncbi:MAG: MBL fold metallo-hydrolase [Bacteroidetes bacterium]|nr:MBL fold metallo-hydrolase [Bacteroidota bacterium]